MSSFDNGFAVGYVLGKKKGGGSGGDCNDGILSVEEAIIENGGVVDKVSSIPTFEELVLGVFTILDGYPLRLFNISDNVEIATISYTDSATITFPNIINVVINDTVDITILNYTDEAEGVLT